MYELQETPISQSYLSSLRYFAKNSYIEMKRRFCYYLLALISVTVVVCAAQIAQTLTDRSQVIYLQAGEQQHGQIDMKILPNIDYIKSTSQRSRKQERSLFNYTQIQNRLETVNLHTFTSARNSFLTNLTVANALNKCEINEETKIEDYDLIHQKCKKYTKAQLIFIDTEGERQNQIGRLYTESEIPKDQVVISQEIANLLSKLKIHIQFYIIHIKMQKLKEIKEGETIIFGIEISLYLFHLVDNYCSSPQYYKTNFCIAQFNKLESDTFNIFMAAKVYKIIDDNAGKTSFESSKTTIFMERKYFIETINKYAQAQNSDQLVVLTSENFIQGMKGDFLVNEVILNYPNRIDLYTQNQFDKIEVIVNQYASNTARALGIYALSIDIPIMELFHKLKYASMFLSIVTNMIILLFSSLSIMMLYNLLLVSVETKTYELGVLRIVGLNKFGVIGLIVTQSLSFVFPGVIIGILIAIEVLKIASEKFKDILGIEIEQSPSINSYALCLFLGIVIPLASSVVPIKRALSSSLSFALDKERSKSQAVKITVDVEGKMIKWGQISFGLLCTIFGFSIYYLLPLSLFKMDLGLLISIFFFILIGLLIGLILISVNFSYLFERIVVYTCFFWVGSSTRKIVLKNLASHRIKNTRTSIMYGLSIAFVVFVWSAMALQIDSQYYSKLQSKGANYVVEDTRSYINVPSFENILLTDLKDIVRSYTFVAGNSDYSLQNKGSTSVFYIKNKGKLIEFEPNIIGVQPNYLKTTRSDYLIIEKKSSSALDIVEELYTYNGNGKMIMSKQYAEQLFYTTDIDLDDSSEENILFLEKRDSKKSKIYKFQVSSIVSSFPGMKMSADPSSESDSYPNVIVSIPTFYSLIENTSIDESAFMFDKLIIDADLEDHDTIHRKLSLAQSYKQTNSFWSFKSSKEELESNMALINLIFSGLGTLVMVLCFFSLISSMTANIYEQTKEIAILRAVGISKFKISLIYVYESFVLVFSSCIMGTLVGLIIGYSMSMQRQLFTQMTVSYRFPWNILQTQFIISIVCAFGSTILPIVHLVKQPISAIIRKTF